MIRRTHGKSSVAIRLGAIALVACFAAESTGAAEPGERDRKDAASPGSATGLDPKKLPPSRPAGADLSGRVSGPTSWPVGQSGDLRLEVSNPSGARFDAALVLLRGARSLRRAGGAALPGEVQRKAVKFAKGTHPTSTIAVSVPPSAAPGAYAWCLVLDPANAVAETDENNNVACQAVQVLAVADGRTPSIAEGAALSAGVAKGLADRQVPLPAEAPDPLSARKQPLLIRGATPPTESLAGAVGDPARPGLRESAERTTPERERLAAATKARMLAPSIELFEAQTGDCVEPDPFRDLLRYRVVARDDGPSIAVVRIHAVPDEGPIRLVYEWLSPPDTETRRAEQLGIRDEASSFDTVAYNLVVTDSRAFKTHRRISFRYDLPMRFEPSAPGMTCELDRVSSRMTCGFLATYENVETPTVVGSLSGGNLFVSPRWLTFPSTSSGSLSWQFSSSSLCDIGDPHKLRFTIHVPKAQGRCDPTELLIEKSLSDAEARELCKQYRSEQSRRSSPDANGGTS